MIVCIFIEKLIVVVQVDDNHSDGNKRSDSSSLSPKCTAPIVSIVHHKSGYHQGTTKFAYNDLVLQKVSFYIDYSPFIYRSLYQINYLQIFISKLSSHPHCNQ